MASNTQFIQNEFLFFQVRNVTIYVDVEGQKELLQRGNLYNVALDIPTFPLNTDGIDPSGVDVLIEDITIQNFDDAVAVKPMNGELLARRWKNWQVIEKRQLIFNVQR